VGASRCLSGLAILVLLSCEDNTGLVGFKNPNRDFQVFEKEFTIPTKVFLMDSLSTSNGSSTTETKRILVGHMDDPRFGKTSATAYTQYWPVGYPAVNNANPVFEKLTLTLVYDYYWQGNANDHQEAYQVYEVTDSILTYLPHYSSQSTPYGPLLGEAQKLISPTDFEQSILDNGDLDTSNDIVDSLNIDLDANLGRRLLTAAMDTVGLNESNYDVFSRFRRTFKGLAIVGSNNDKIVGFNTFSKYSKMVLHYRIDTTKYRLTYQLNAPGASGSLPEYVSYTELKTDRSGTPLAGLPPKYIEFEPADGLRYAQAGTGLAVRLDFTEVRDHFKNIPVKALSVAELRVETDEQQRPVVDFILRALRPNNRPISATKGDVDGAGDPITIIDNELVFKHAVVAGSTRLDPISDNNDGAPFRLHQSSNKSGTALYTGYLTTFLQKETSLGENDFLRYFALIPQAPENGKSVNGFYFPADKIKLKIYYTTPGLEE
jgi:hypothetical protein